MGKIGHREDAKFGQKKTRPPIKISTLSGPINGETKMLLLLRTPAKSNYDVVAKREK